MKPTFHQLEAFYWIAKLGSVKEAARQLRLTPPTISLRIDDLEADLGEPVFERAGRGLVLTRRGEALVPRVASVMDEYGKLRDALDGGRQADELLRIGATETFAQVCLPGYLRTMSARYPDLRLEFTIATSADLERDVLERRVDVAFAVNPTGDPKLTLVPLGSQAVTWAAAPSFGLSSPLHPDHLRDMLIITNPPPTPMWRQITDWFRQAGQEPARLCRCSSPTVATRMVAAGIGVSLLPRLLAQPGIKEGTLCALDSELALQPSRVFAIYRFAESSSFVEEVIGLGRATMETAGLLERYL